VIGVEPDGPAAAAGMRAEDLIVAIDGGRVERMDDVLRLMSGDAIGVRVQVSVVRAGRRVDLSLTPAELGP
jgi:S1-C subfamily serine protease